MTVTQAAPKSDTLPGGLSPDQIAQYHRDGYLVIPNALDSITVTSLLAETHKLLDNFSLDDHPMTGFSTGDRASHINDEYFLSSGDKIRFFFEEAAFDSSGALTKPKSRAINKIGHNLMGLSEPFGELLTAPLQYSPRAVARSLGYRAPRCLQSIVICKQPEIGGAVRPHQDSTFLYTNPPSALGFWYALEDASVTNGCLSFIPGSHRTAGVKKRFVTKTDRLGTEFIDNNGSQFPLGGETDECIAHDEYRTEEVKSGSLVLIHGNVLHKSEKNLSCKSRFVYTFHVIESEGVEYDERNWLQPPEGGFTML